MENKIDRHGKEIVPCSDNSPGSNHGEDYYLFLVCIHCIDTIMIRYPAGSNLGGKDGLAQISPSILMVTGCRECMTADRKPGALCKTKHETKRHADAISTLIASPSFTNVDVSRINVPGISSGLDTPLLQNGKSARYISIADISDMCDRRCRVWNINTNAGVALPYLRIGFF